MKLLLHLYHTFHSTYLFINITHSIASSSEEKSGDPILVFTRVSVKIAENSEYSIFHSCWQNENKTEKDVLMLHNLNEYKQAEKRKHLD